MDRKIANYLLTIKAVTLDVLNPYLWASGIKAPIYCDNRLTLSYPKIRKEIEIGLAELIKSHYKETDMIIGTATAGIAHAALVAEILDLPMGYVRGNHKTHGKGNKIEGAIKGSEKVVVVEDLISTGMSCLDVVRELQEKNVTVLGVVSIFTYNLPEATEKFEKENINYHSLSSFNTLIEVAYESSYISLDHYHKLKQWHENPNNYDGFS